LEKTQSVTIAKLSYDPLSMTIIGLTNTGVFLTQDFSNLVTVQLPSVPQTSRFPSATYDSTNKILYIACSWYKGFLQKAMIFYSAINNPNWNSATLPQEIMTAGQIIFGNGAIVVQGYNLQAQGINLYSSKNGSVWENTLFLNSDECILSYCGPKGAEKLFVSCGIVDSYTSEDGFTWKRLQGDISNAFSISYVPNLGFVAGLLGNYSTSQDGENFVGRTAITDTLTPITSFSCLGKSCISVSSYDNSIFVL